MISAAVLLAGVFLTPPMAAQEAPYPLTKLDIEMDQADSQLRSAMAFTCRSRPARRELGKATEGFIALEKRAEAFLGRKPFIQIRLTSCWKFAAVRFNKYLANAERHMKAARGLIDAGEHQ